jgi:hypothetical protein
VISRSAATAVMTGPDQGLIAAAPEIETAVQTACALPVLALSWVSATDGLTATRSLPPAGAAVALARHDRPRLLVLQLLTAVAGGPAAAGHLIGRRLGDDLSGWLSGAAAFVLAAHINYCRHPLLDTQTVSAGDYFSLCFSPVLLIGPMPEIREYWLVRTARVTGGEQRVNARVRPGGLGREVAYLTRFGLVAMRKGVSSVGADPRISRTPENAPRSRRSYEPGTETLPARARGR